MGIGEPSRPLAALCDRLLHVRPAKLSVMVTLMDEVEDYQDFKRLIAEFVPEAAPEILKAGSPADTIAAFAEAFGQRYFPLSNGMIDASASFSDLLRFIPIETFGWEEDAYHDIPTDTRQGIILSSLLVDFEGELGWDGDGVRVTVLEAAEGFISRELLARVPPRGYPLDSLRGALSRRYRGLLYFAEQLCHDSPNQLLNITYEDVWTGPPEWDRAVVEQITEDWRDFLKKDKAMVSFWEWLEKKPEARFRVVLDFLESEA
ncbi:MAG: hypothetical protein HY669_00665 [Chloroflexi bacterium]|nr:hypothetical protein [Chloroflexota bacterium]